jgi:UDP-N-acetyl-D-mannosaminuronate dehydrogenase
VVVRAYDPLVHTCPREEVVICGSVRDALTGCDAAIITSALPELRALDWNALAEQMRRPIVIDGRNVLRGVKLPGNIEYVPIGRHYQRKESGEQRRRSAKAAQGH